MNQIELTARIAELSPLRYTPAGLPAANLVLEHESEQTEAGSVRQVRLSIRAVAFGAPEASGEGGAVSGAELNVVAADRVAQRSGQRTSGQ